MGTMGRERALRAIQHKETDRIPQIEYIAHPLIVKKLSGLDPRVEPERALSRTYDALDMDLLWYTDEPYRLEPEFYVGTKYGETEWGWGTSQWRLTYPFRSVEEVLAYWPTKQFEISEADSYRRYADTYREMCETYPTPLVPGGYYDTLFMWCQRVFGLEWTIKAAKRDQDRFDQLLDGFSLLSLRDMRAWAKVKPPVFISHDDLCSSQGPFFSPRWYKEHIFSRYKKIWAPLKEASIPILFCSDGKIDLLVEGLIDAGADGFIIEPSVNMAKLAKRYGDTKVIIGNASTALISYGSVNDTVNEVKRCVAEAGQCAGYFFNATGGITHNMPLENVEAYFEACRTYGDRRKSNFYVRS
jgi:hypothetical protein